MMITGKSGMRFDTERIRKEEPKKFNWNNLFFGACLINMGFLIGYVLCAMWRAF